MKRPNISILSRRLCTGVCKELYTDDFCNPVLYHGFRKADLRIYLKDNHRNNRLREASESSRRRSAVLSAWLIRKLLNVTAGGFTAKLSCANQQLRNKRQDAP